jgi:hypothetical protein
MDIIEKLLQEYSELRREDLDTLNPEYSCIICANTSCDNIGKKGSCPYHIRCDVINFRRTII